MTNLPSHAQIVVIGGGNVAIDVALYFDPFNDAEIFLHYSEAHPSLLAVDGVVNLAIGSGTPTDGSFDEAAPENISPLVVWLGSAESREVTGRVFEVKGGMIGISDGWRDGPTVDKGARWDPDEVGSAVAGLIEKAPAAQKVFGT